MDKYAAILNTVLKEITPRKQELASIKKYVDGLNTKIQKKGLKATAVVGGSYAKGTFLKGDHDVDIFVKFSLRYKKDDLSELLAELVPHATRVHGSRDYFQLQRGTISYELVPVLDIKRPEQAQNVTDFSPWHVNWVVKNGKTLGADIRLAKRFCKANKLYGAESYLKGVSGHVLDILIIHYGGFINWLQAARHWDKREVVDTYNYYDGKALLKMNESKIQCPLIVVDPVSPARNAASALGWDKFDKLCTLAEEFLHHPRYEFFVPKKIDLRALKKRHGTLLMLEVWNNKGKVDVQGGRLLKVYEKIKRILDDHYIHDSDWDWDKEKKAVFWYVIDKKALPLVKEVRGPPVKQKTDAKKFRGKHKDTFIKRGRLFAHERRKKRDARARVEAVMADPLIAERIKRWKVKYYG